MPKPINANGANNFANKLNVIVTPTNKNIISIKTNTNTVINNPSIIFILLI